MRWQWLVMLVLAACSGPDRGGDDPREGRGARGAGSVTVVEVAEVAQGSVADRLITTAVLESEAQADLVPPAAGIVRAIHREEGDRVRRGDVLAVIDNVQLDAGAERSSAEVAKLERDLTELRALRERGAASDAEVREATFRLEAARTTAREAARSLGQTRITAPFDGVVAARDLRLGEYVGSGQRAFRVVDLARLRVVASLPERDLPRVAPDQPVRLVSAYDPAHFATGRVARISPVVEAETGTFRVTIEVDPESGPLRPGQFVSVQIEVERREGVVVVARPAVVWEDGQPVIYRKVPAPEPDEAEAGEDEQPTRRGWLARAGRQGDTDEPEAKAPPGPRFVAERVRVELGLQDDRVAQVLRGIEKGDRVVVIGQSTLRDGAAITTPELRAERERAARESQDAAGDEG